MSNGGPPALLDDRVEKKWDSFSWITLRALISSINHVINLGTPRLVAHLRCRWNKAYPIVKNDLWDEHRVVRRPGNTRFIVLGDPGEQDASQYVLVPALREVRDGVAFMVIMSDVIYPSGDVNDYVDGFYIPYGQLPGLPIYALPGNHDWYDGLAGFMWHFCGFEPLPRDAYGTTGWNPLEWLCRLLWRQPSARKPRLRLEECRERRRLPREPRWRPLQPGSYFAIDTEHLRIVCIDTGIKGDIDAAQGDWLLDVSKDPGPKLLLTGKPLVVNHGLEPCKITGGPVRRDGDERAYSSVLDIVTSPQHGYVATAGGDIHNYQRYRGPHVAHVVAGGGGAYMSATHPVPVAKDGRCAKESDAEAVELYPTAEDSLSLFARILLPKLWRLERALIAALSGFGAAAAWIELTDDHDALRTVLLWGAVALAPLFVVRTFMPARATKRWWYRACWVLEAFLAGAVICLAGWWLAPSRFVTNAGWAAGLIAGGSVLALLLRWTGWWRPYEQALEAPAWVRRTAGLGFLALGAGSVAAAHVTGTWQIAVAGVTLSVAALAGWRMRGGADPSESRRGCWWRIGAQVTAYAAQLVAALFLIDAFVIPGGAGAAFWWAAAGIPGGLLLLIPGFAAVFVAWVVPASVAGRVKGVGVGGGWGLVGRFARGSLWLGLAGLVAGYWFLLDWRGVGTDPRRAALTAFMTLAVPVAAAFVLDSVRRRTWPGLPYKVAVAAVIAVVAAAVARFAGDTWVPEAIVAGAVLLAVALAGILIVHLTFLGAPALAWDCHTHRDQDQLSLAEADRVIEWRTGGEAPKERHVRRRANIVFPGANRPSGPLQRKIAEVCDTDGPPFRKGFLVVEALEHRLTIQPYEVTGQGPASTPAEPIVVDYRSEADRAAVS